MWKCKNFALSGFSRLSPRFVGKAQSNLLCRYWNFWIFYLEKWEIKSKTYLYKQCLLVLIAFSFRRKQKNLCPLWVEMQICSEIQIKYNDF